MRQKDRKLCVDASVKRGAECNTDHQFLCAKLRMPWKRVARKETRRFDVSRLVWVSGEGKEALVSTKQEYVKAVLERADKRKRSGKW